MKRTRKQLTERECARERVDRTIANRFSSSSMSDTKWVRLFDAFTKPAFPLARCRVKLVWDEEIRTMWLRGCTFMFDYWPRAVEGMITGFPRGWYDYKEIEWLEFTGTADELCEVSDAIRSVGLFDCEKSEGRLRLRAYR